MSNIIVSVRYALDIPESLVVSLVGRPDDQSDDWYQEACNAAEEWARDHPVEQFDYIANGEPDYEAD